MWCQFHGSKTLRIGCTCALMRLNALFLFSLHQVNHSQRMSERPLTPWVVCEKNGKVLTAHCDCMAGIGESCSHVASLLWAVEAGARKRDSLTVTDKKAYWVLPSAVKAVPYAKVQNINFSKFNKKCEGKMQRNPVPAPSSSELDEYFKTISSFSSKPAILSLIHPYSDCYVPKALHSDLPPVKSDLYDPTLLDKSLETLLELSESKMDCFNVTVEQQKAVEEKTRDQANSRLWFRFRAGRVTASRFKAACCTNRDSPSKSLITSICYPELKKFSTAATRWGCQHEEVARDKYRKWLNTNHENVSVTNSGFWIHLTHGFLVASPDGLVSCQCCGTGICEIKCPFCHKDETIETSTNDRLFCIEVNSDGTKQLKRTCAYYYQVMAQLSCTGLSYCDFVVWTEKDLFLERILQNNEFVERNIEAAKKFVLRGLLPELTGK
ncbi:uncharacterized protein LOC124451003 [Xenia sp. Carnegie-2017]|uniref:uncharacterized protein LOC124451003 n=1 Tax=Xenia sp. Carnegie-2017 TaxID=2897299 RepID=UPI001F04E3BB|nr:uncharacterized protein LOC124451003 [Xenia sp. Carnegie-2017]